MRAIVSREAENDYGAHIVANAMEASGVNVFAITNEFVERAPTAPGRARRTGYVYRVWGRVTELADPDVMDDAIEAALEACK